MSIYNQTHFTNFYLDIPDAGLTKGFRLNIQGASIPGIRTPGVELPAGTQGFARATIPGSTIEFDPLVIRVLIDENLDSWVELYKWMLITNNYITQKNEAQIKEHVPEFITLHVLDNTKENIVLSIHYFGAWVGELGEVEFNFTEEGDPPITMITTFPYKYFKVERNGQIIESRMSIRDAALSKGDSNDASMPGLSNDLPKVGMHPSLAKR